MSESLQSWLGKTPTQIKDEVVKIAKKELNVETLKPQGVLTGLVYTFAIVVSWIYKTFLTPLTQQVSLDNATGTFLENWGLMLGVARKEATKTRGVATLKTNKVLTIPKDSALTIRGSSLTFLVQNEYKDVAKTQEHTIVVEASEAGAQGNVGSVSPARLGFKKLPLGLESVELRTGWITNEGTDAETDETYRARIKAQWLRSATGDVPLLYKAEAEGIQGVSEAKVFRTPSGVFGSTRILLRGPANTKPNDATCAAVRARLNTVGLVARALLVEPIMLIPLRVSFAYKGRLTEADAKRRVTDYLYRLSIGERYTMQDLYNLFDDQEAIQFTTPTASDTVLPVDAVYNFFHSDITATKEV